MWAAVMAAPLLDEALSELLKEEKAMLRARQGPSGPEQDGRRKERRTKNKAAPVESSDQAKVSVFGPAISPGAQQQDLINVRMPRKQQCCLGCLGFLSYSATVIVMATFGDTESRDNVPTMPASLVATARIRKGLMTVTALQEAPQKQECSRCEGNGAAAHSMLR